MGTRTIRRTTGAIVLKHLSAALIVTLSVMAPAPTVSAWPNAPDEDPRLDPPNDPGFAGQWNLWSYVPEEWAKNEGFREEEISLGTGIHADRAWQITPGDRRVIIAVLDSGAYWDNRDLVNKYYLNRGELGSCLPSRSENSPAPERSPTADPFDLDESGWLDIRDYYAGYEDEASALADWDVNGNGMLDPQDLIMKCSDGIDDDGNGYIDDISGWDFMRNDNDAYDDTRYGHGNGEARDSCAEGNNGIGDIGVCPGCTALMVRVGDSFIVDANDFAQGTIFGVDSGASVIQEALGSINNTPFSQEAINYAYDNNVVVIASAADELSYHHNYPGTNNHTVYVHAVQHDQPSAALSTTFLNFNNCTNYGMQLLLSTPGGGCSSEATGISSGHAGLIYSAALKAGLDPPLSAEEAKQIMTHAEGIDDINVNPLDNDPTKFPSAEGWDWHFGYGRNNARKTLDMIMAGRIPPEVDILSPAWFAVLYPDRTKTVEITGRINVRRDAKATRYEEVSWSLEYAMGVDPKGEYVQIAKGNTEGLEGLIATWDLSAIDHDLNVPLTDPHQHAVTLRLRATATLSDGSTITGEHRKGFLLARDDTLLEAFPKDLGSSGECSPVFADLDGDKIQELVIPLADGSVHVFESDGSELEGFPVHTRIREALHPDFEGHVRNSCAFRETKTDCHASVGVLSPEIHETMMLAPAVGDLDGDGHLEIVAATWDGRVYVWHHDGKLKDGWPRSVDFSKSKYTDRDHLLDGGFMAAPVLYDLDSDGTLEVIAAAMDQHIYAWTHEGTPFGPYPVRVSDLPIEEKGERIITTPAVGDFDGDGRPEIASGTNESLGAGGAQNQAKAYVLDGLTGAIEPGWPQTLFGLMTNVLPVVGSGVPSNPIAADLDFDGTLELSIDTIASPGNILRADGTKFATMNNRDFGKGSDSTDSPAYVLMNNGAIGYIDRSGGLDLVKGTAGFDFAIAFAGGGQRGYFDHHLSGWDTDTTEMLEGFPRVIDDWQFFNTPSIVDLNNDTDPEVVIGSAGYLLHAWDFRGQEAEHFPKQTGGWIIASAAVGEFDGDGLFEVAITTRNGRLFVWDTEGKVGSIFEWNGYGHDPHNTNNYELPATPYAVWDTASSTPPNVDSQETSDASTQDTTTSSSTSSDAPKEPTSSGGCQSSAYSSSSTSGSIILVALIALLLTARRMRNRHGLDPY